eukprot:scaffold94889_cov65-Phaeocystis_antarctica.AAC.1
MRRGTVGGSRMQPHILNGKFGYCLSACTGYKLLQAANRNSCEPTQTLRRHARPLRAGSALTQRATTAPELAPTHPTLARCT